MGIIVCQTCDAIIDYYDGEKVTVLYAKCNCEKSKSKKQAERAK